MQKSIIKLTNAELELISDPGISILKQNALRKISDLFHVTGQNLQHTYPSGNSHYKITRGENYLQHPYIVVDYPKIGNMDFPVLYRTMFWWGHYFAFEFMLKKELCNNRFEPLLREADMHVLIGDDLWNNDVNGDQYATFSEAALATDNNHAHIKLVKTWPVHLYENMSEEAGRYYALCTELIG